MAPRTPITPQTGVRAPQSPPKQGPLHPDRPPDLGLCTAIATPTGVPAPQTQPQPGSLHPDDHPNWGPCTPITTNLAEAYCRLGNPVRQAVLARRGARYFPAAGEAAPTPDEKDHGKEEHHEEARKEERLP